MARKKAKGQPAYSTTFVRYTLTANDKKAIPAFQKAKENDFDALMTEVLGASNKVSFSFNETNDTYICSVTGKKDESINSELCYTSFGPNWGVAAWVAFYKYFEVWKGGVWESLDETQDFG